MPGFSVGIGRLGQCGASVVKTIGQELGNLLWSPPEECLLCCRPLPPPAFPWSVWPDQVKQLLCPDCLHQLPYVRQPYCAQCGRPHLGGSAICRLCRAGVCSIKGGSATAYTGVMQELITEFKFKGRSHLALPLGELVSVAAYKVTEGWSPAAVVPIPLHSSRQAVRGYNQSLLLGERVALRLKRPLWPDVLVRRRVTAFQSGLRLHERRKNVQGAFAAPEVGLVAGKRLLLVDDVLTTGTTLSAAAFSLIQAGAAEVRFATVAVTLSGRDVIVS